MRGYEISKKAFLMLGFGSENEVTLHGSTSSRDLEFINQIASDLKLSTLSELSNEVNWNDEEIRAVISGLAMLLSFTEGETAKNQLFTTAYNAKRAALLSKVEKIEDTLPTSESGDI